MAGVSTAKPIDALGAMFWNPAAIGRLGHNEASIGGAFVYPDITLSSSLPQIGGPPLSGTTRSDNGISFYTSLAGWRFTLVVNYKSFRHARTRKRKQKKWLFATWKIRRTPTEIPETYRRRFGIETSYRQLNQARARTTTRDTLYRRFLVGLALLLRNLWQWLTYWTLQERKRQKQRGDTLTALPRFKDILLAFALVLYLNDDHSPVRAKTQGDVVWKELNSICGLIK